MTLQQTETRHHGVTAETRCRCRRCRGDSLQQRAALMRAAVERKYPTADAAGLQARVACEQRIAALLDRAGR